MEATEIQADLWNLVPVNPRFVGIGDLTVSADISTTTKSQLSDNGTHASVNWTTGDDFIMVDEEGNYTTYSTSESGPKVDFSGGATLPGAGPFLCFYPSSSFTAMAPDDNDLVYGEWLYGVTIPSNQSVALGKNVAEGANVSFAMAASQSADLYFQNIGSIIKFKLSGSLVPNIGSISLLGTDKLSGTIVMAPTSEGAPEICPGITFNYYPAYSSVTLTGSFVTGQEYYIAVAPGTHNGFSISFTDSSDDTKKVTKYSSKTLILNRSQITDFGTIDVGGSYDTPVESSLIIEHTTSKYATIAVIPDGYTEAEMAQYVTDAQSGINALFDTEPYKTYRNYFNVWLLKVASNESGARISDGSPAEQTRDCFFQSTWGSDSYDNMSANANRIFQFVEENCPDVYNGVHSIQDVPVLVMINDTRYGGIAWNYSNGQTYCMVPRSYNGAKMHWSYPSKEAASVSASAAEGHISTVTVADLTELGWTELKGGTNEGTWMNTLVHEFGGHSIGKLGDEYWYNGWKGIVGSIASHTWPVPMNLNVSATLDQASVPWAELFDAGIQSKMAASLYHDKYNRIGVFQGADVSMFNRWRSEKISCMIDNRQYFSTWQRYIIVNRIMTLAGLPAISVEDFLDNDIPTDPVRDGSPVIMPNGVSNQVPSRPVPMLPPPRIVEGSPRR